MAPSDQTQSTQHIELKRSKIQLIATLITMITAILGFGGGYLKLQEQSRTLKAAVSMPLEGIWDYKVTYDKFHNEDYTKDDSSNRKEMNGRAAFVWNHQAGSGQYDVLIVGSVSEVGDPNEILTTASESIMFALEEGEPVKNMELRGKYIARTSSVDKFKNPSNLTFTYNPVEFKEDHFGRIYRISYDIETRKSKGKATFTRSN